MDGVAMIDENRKKYRHVTFVTARPYVVGEILDPTVWVSSVVKQTGSPKAGDMIVRLGNGREFLTTAEYFTKNYELEEK